MAADKAPATKKAAPKKAAPKTAAKDFASMTVAQLKEEAKAKGKGFNLIICNIDANYQSN